MKKIVPVHIYLSFITLIFAFFIFTNSYSQNIPFTILHFNDSHSNLTGMGPKNEFGDYLKGGFDRAASLIKSVRSTDSNVMVFHIGDYSTGSFFFNRYFGVPELMLFKKYNFDAIALGNHEFDLGPAVLFAALSQSFLPGSLPVLSANLNMSGFPALSSYVTPYNIKTIDGVKIGLFGLTIPDPSSNPYPVVISDSILQIAQSTVSVLQSSGCNVIICLSHLGYGYDSQIASLVSGIHIILGAHDHSTFLQPVPIPNPAGFNTLVCQAGSYYEHAGKMNLVYNKGTLSMTGYQLIDIDSNIPRDDSVRAFLDSLKPGIVSKYGDVFTNTVSYVIRDIAPSFNELMPERDTPLGNFINDAHKRTTGSQISLTAIGLMSQPLYRGPLTGEDILRSVPYGYDTSNGLDLKLVKFNITGSELKRGLELVLYAATSDISYLPQTSGLTFDYNSTLALGYKILLPTMKVNDTLISLTGIYSVTANEGLFKALNLLGITVSNVEVTGINEYTSIANYANQFRKISSGTKGRLKDVSVTSVKNPVALAKEFELFQNYPNPFNQTTIINYQTSITGNIRIKVFDIAGRELTTLVNERKNPGKYSVLFDAGSLSSGIYFYQLSINSPGRERLEAKKMLLIK
ncbi:MAG: 5'-nucleotidase C-terminal domain-containing protein [Ignavibacteria bacterium]|nr:5'-nucleotidase C-terminal domain-containing protein [Ignavibacteria bacterium]